MLQIAGNGLEAVNRLADHREATGPSAVLAAKAKAGIEIREIINQFIEWICFILECGCDGESIPLMEKTGDSATHGWSSFLIDQLQPTPQQSSSGGGWKLAADGHERADGAVVRQNISIDWFEEGHAMAVYRDTHGLLGKA